MNILSQKFFEDKFTHSSAILNPGSNPPQERDLQSLQYFLEEIVHEEKGSLHNAQKILAKAKQGWLRYNATQVNKFSEPQGRWAENISEAKARIKILKKEALFLDKAIVKFEKEAVRVEKEEINPKRKYKLVGRIDANGNYLNLDGRAVKAGKFLDDGSSVQDYIKKAKEFQTNKVQALHKEQAQRQAA